MSKEYIPGETKDQRKARKALEKRQRDLAKAPAPIPKSAVQSNKLKNYIVCLKHGKKYSSQYVNNLYSMCKRHCSLDFEFVCFTEDPMGIDERYINIRPLPQIDSANGWWYKPMFFDKDLPVKGNILYMDLDVVVFDSIDKLFGYEQDKFCIIRDFNRSIRKDWRKMNSSVFRFKSGHMDYLYEEFKRNPKSYIHRLHGDQDYIFEVTKKDDFLWWPDEWIQSYKWEMRDRRDLIRIDGKRNFRENKQPIIKPQTCIAVFHGEPYPHEVTDKWVVDNWR